MPEYSAPRHKACLVCRGRKIKCDGAQPKCSRCMRSGDVCNYAPPAKRYNKAEFENMLETLKQRVSQAEAAAITAQTAAVTRPPEFPVSVQAGDAWPPIAERSNVPATNHDFVGGGRPTGMTGPFLDEDFTIPDLEMVAYETVDPGIELSADSSILGTPLDSNQPATTSSDGNSSATTQVGCISKEHFMQLMNSDWPGLQQENHGLSQHEPNHDTAPPSLEYLQHLQGDEASSFTRDSSQASSSCTIQTEPATSEPIQTKKRRIEQTNSSEPRLLKGHCDHSTTPNMASILCASSQRRPIGTGASFQFVPKLRGAENYNEWFRSLRGAARIEGVWDSMLGNCHAPAPPGPEATAEELERYHADLVYWRNKQELAAGGFEGSLGDEVFREMKVVFEKMESEYGDLGCMQQLWGTLENKYKYGGNAGRAVHDLIKELEGASLDKAGSVGRLAEEVRKVRGALDNRITKEKLPEWYYSVRFLLGLGQGYETFVESVLDGGLDFANTGRGWSFDDIAEKAKVEETRLAEEELET